MSLVVANWKMYGTAASTEAWLSVCRSSAEVFSGCEAVVCPPFPYLAQMEASLSGISICLGAQNVAAQQDGAALTGEVSAKMLLDVGCRWVVLGHSERRSHLAETDATVAKKLLACAEEGLGVILCVGENTAAHAEEVLAQQIAAFASVLDRVSARQFVLAYEPVWAIGTGVHAEPSVVEKVHAFLRNQLAAHRFREGEAGVLRIIYGGSVTSVNAAQLMALPQVDGVLVGGASRNAEEFLQICKVAV